MTDAKKPACPTRSCLRERKVTAEGYALLYRLFDGKIREESGEEVPCYSLEIALVGIPSGARGETCDTVFLEDISRDPDQAMAIAALLAEESVMPCTALEVMEELFSYGELPEEILFRKF